MNELDALLHQPLRTQIAAFLAASGEVTFSDLKRQLDVSDGNLDSHLKKLIAAEYVSVRKDSGDGRPQSYFVLTPAGQKALQNYVAALQKLLTIKPARAGESASGWGRTKILSAK